MCTVLTLEDVKNQIKKISTLSLRELDVYMQELSLSDIDDKSRGFIVKAGELCRKELEEISVSPFVECSEFSSETWNK